MVKKGFSKCPTCSGNKKSKRKMPYGTTGTNPYCFSCDRDYTYKVSKTSVRMKSKIKIKKELND